MTPSRRLIVNADDYGRTTGIAHGILQSCREGIVTSTTAMMNMPGIGELLSLARQEPDLGIGIHLVFTSGRPLLPTREVPSLVDSEGSFWGVGDWLSRLDRIDLSELRAEWQAQLVSFRDLAGEPDHLDCHHFLHVYPPIFGLYLNFASQEDLPIRVPFQTNATNDADASAIGEDLGVQPAVVASYLKADRDLLEEYPVRHPDHFIGRFYGDQNLRVERLMEILESVPEGVSELMVHPGLVDEELHGVSSYGWQRERELEILCHPQVKERLSTLDIVLAGFGILG